MAPGGITHHDRADGDESIVHEPRMLDIRRLEGHLKRTAPSTECESIKVNMILDGTIRKRIEIRWECRIEKWTRCISIEKHWYIDCES